MTRPSVTLGLAVLSSAVLCGACTAAPSGGPAEQRASLGGDTVARVGETTIPAETVRLVAAAQGLAPRAALSLLIDDALAANGAAARGLDRNLSTRRQVDAALARSVVVRIREAARGDGPPSDGELAALTALHWRDVDLPEQMRVVHAVVLRPKRPTEELATRARALAELLAAREAGAKDDVDFEARARTLAHPDLDLKVERLRPFVADGRVAEGADESTYDKVFAAAAASLAPGETSGVVETSFGWHVILVTERLPPKRMPLGERRVIFADEAVAARARRAMDDLQTELREASHVDLANGVDALLGQAASFVTQGDAPPEN